MNSSEFQRIYGRDWRSPPSDEWFWTKALEMSKNNDAKFLHCHPSKIKRNTIIFEELLSGKTLSEVSKKIGLSETRVKQIYSDYMRILRSKVLRKYLFP